MIYLKKYGKCTLYTLLSIIISISILTLLYHFNIISPTINKCLKIISLLICIFINSFILGKKSNKQGYLEGIKLGIIIIIIFLLLALILKLKLKPRVILYYIIILITATLGSMLGINKKKSSK